MKTSVWGNVTVNRAMVVYIILKFTIEGLKIAARKFTKPFPDATANKRICFLNPWFNENDKAPTFYLSSITSFRWKRTQSCDTYCTMGRLFCVFKVTKGWVPERVCCHKLDKYNPYHYIGNWSVFETLSLEIFRSISLRATLHLVWCERELFPDHLRTIYLIVALGASSNAV